MRAFVPVDSTARSLGADQVADALAGNGVELVRNGSRGLYWLEPMLELELDGERHAFGPVDAEQAKAIVAGPNAAMGNGHYLGPTEQIGELQSQTRLTFTRVGITDPLSIDDYVAHGGFKGLRNALEMSAGDIVKAVTDSGLRGRGGAAFPTGIKWQTVLDTMAAQKYIVCNADEGDSGTFADRMIMESDPYMLIEGMIIAGLAVGATEGFIYARAEYPQAIDTLTQAIAAAEDSGYLGDDVCGLYNAVLGQLPRTRLSTFREIRDSLRGLGGWVDVDLSRPLSGERFRTELHGLASKCAGTQTTFTSWRCQSWSRGD